MRNATSNLPAPTSAEVSNLPALATTEFVPAPPVVTTTSAVDSWTVHLGPVTATITREYEPLGWSTVYVDNDLAEALDPRLAELAKAERGLGDDRCLDRGIDAEVDALYDALNERVSEIKTAVAVVVLPMLGAVLDSCSYLLDKVEFDPYAGCRSCKCSPGVKAPYARRWGGFVQISIEAAGA